MNRVELEAAIMEVFEDFLEAKGIRIESSEQAKKDDDGAEENTAILYGDDYWGMSDQIENILADAGLLDENREPVNANEIKVPISDGKLVAFKGSDPDYPSAGICYETADGTCIDLALAEQTPDTKDRKEISLIAYSDVTTEDYTHKFAISIPEIMDALK